MDIKDAYLHGTVGVVKSINVDADNNITYVLADKNNTAKTININNMTGAKSDADGKSGLVPAPTSGKQAQFLRGDGTWATPANTNYYRPISINDTSILGNNNVALNLIQGSNIVLTPEKNASNAYTGKVTISSPNSTTTSQAIPYIEGNSTGTAGTWTGFYEGITEYTNGLTIVYVPRIAGANPTTLNINDLGAKTCYITTGSKLTTHFRVGTPIIFTYVDGDWLRADYNSDTTYRNSLYYYYFTAGSTGIPSYNICMLDSENKIHGIANKTGTGTDKVKNSTKFNLGYGCFYYSGSTINKDTVTNSGTLYRQLELIDFRYSSNCAKTLISQKMVYLVGTVDESGYFSLDDIWYTQTIGTDTSKVYIPIGIAYDTYRIFFKGDHPPMCVRNGVLTEFSAHATLSNLATKANSADKLTTSRTIWGQSFDGTANVTGHLYIPNNNYLHSYTTAGTAVTLLSVDSANQVNFAFGAAAQGLTSYINGNIIIFRYGTGHTEALRIDSSGNVGIGITSPTQKLHVQGNVAATSFIGNLDWSYITNKPTSFTPSAHTHTTKQITACTDYAMASQRGNVSTEDSLNIALGKIEYKAQLGVAAYDLVKTATDDDGTIENLNEILKVLQGISDTDTIQGIMNKYLPLAGGTMTGNLQLKVNTTYISSGGQALLAHSNSTNFTGVSNGVNTTVVGNTSYTTLIRSNDTNLVHYKNNASYNILDASNTFINNGVITINGTSITPLTQHQSLSNYVTLDTYQKIVGQKLFNTSSNTIPLLIARGGNNESEVLKIGIDDHNAIFEYVNDETNNSFLFKLVNTDIANGGEGIDANSSQVKFYGDADGSVVIANKFMGQLDKTLTFAAGAFTAKTYNNSSAVTVNIPTHTSHLTNNSGFLTSRGYIGTTAVQVDSAVQNLTGIGTVSMVGPLTITGTTSDNAYIKFSRVKSSTDTYGLNYILAPSGGFLCLGVGNNNSGSIVAMIDSSSVRPYTTNTKTLGTNSYKWNAVYATTFYGALEGSASTLKIQTASGNVNYPILFTTSTTASNGASIYIDSDSKITFNPSTNTLKSGGFVKNESSDAYALLGGGGHVPITRFGELIIGTQTERTNAWKGVTTDTQLYHGKQITYWIPTQYKDSSGITLELTYPNGETTGAVNCYYGGTTRLTNHYGGGNIIKLTYLENVQISGTSYTGWWQDAQYYTSNIYQQYLAYTYLTSHANDGIQGGLVMEDNAGTWSSFKIKNASGTFVKNPIGFVIHSPIYRYGSNVDKNTTFGNWALYTQVTQAKNTFDIGTDNFTVGKMVYLTGTVVDGYLYLADDYITQTPNVVDNVYIPLGRAYNAASIEFLSGQPPLIYDGTKLIPYVYKSTNSTKSRYLETLRSDGKGWYGDSYKFYAQWSASDILDLKCQGYSTRVDIAKKIDSTIVISSKAFSLSNASWIETGYTFTNLNIGTYVIQLTSGSNLVASGIMSVYKNLADTAGDEIPLHVYSTENWRPYLRTHANKLEISSSDTTQTSRTVTIKIAQII